VTGTEYIEILTFGRFAPAPCRRRLWVAPGFPLPVSGEDVLIVSVDRIQAGGRSHDQVALLVDGPTARRAGNLSLSCSDLNFEVVARAIKRDAVGRVLAIWIELINLQRAARAS